MIARTLSDNVFFNDLKLILYIIAKRIWQYNILHQVFQSPMCSAVFFIQCTFYQLLLPSNKLAIAIKSVRKGG